MIVTVLISRGYSCFTKTESPKNSQPIRLGGPEANRHKRLPERVFQQIIPRTIGRLA
ncbi:MAG: hypothetical protein JWM11_2873 [Planctomycetaceae bacterium]|nr:hypothetical protein [Planctomycetaceae bacterium]